ncbi:MAG: hypothetical protein HGA19_06385 [Oscillochloris sp.]|nr:hypothetical protein [Oscillochloris sp.]
MAIGKGERLIGIAQPSALKVLQGAGYAMLSKPTLTTQRVTAAMTIQPGGTPGWIRMDAPSPGQV